MFGNWRRIKRINGLWSTLIIYCLYLEKTGFGFLFSVIRKLFIQPVFCLNISPVSFSKDSLLTLRLPHPFMIIIHGNVRIGINAVIYHEVTLGCIETRNFDAPILGNNVYVGAKSCILGRVKVSDNVKIAACSLILKSVPENITVVGVYK